MTDPPPAEPAPIKASELAQFSFCRRAWWLGEVRRLRPESRAALERGANLHRRHAGQVRASSRWRRLGLLLLAGGGLFLFLVLLLILTGSGG